jgi:hypothetical protein
MSGDCLMSIELPEASILSRQMSSELQRKRIKLCELRDYQKLQRIGFINKRIIDFDRLTDGIITSVISRGNVIHAKIDNGMNLLVAPEYGGRILFHPKGSIIPDKFHLKLRFGDDTAMTVTLTGMGVIKALKDAELENSYVYERDFLSPAPSPMDEKEFTFERFSRELAEKT